MNSKSIERIRQIKLAKKRRKKRLKRKILRNSKFLYKKRDPFIKKKKALRNYQKRRKKKQYTSLVAPANFSFLSNPHETSNYFANIQNTSDRGEPVFLDLQNIEALTIEALMYILAWMDYRNSRNQMGILGGNAPKNPEMKRIFEESGFLDHVKHDEMKSIGKLSFNKAFFRIISGHTNSQTVITQVIDYTIDCLELEGLIATKKLYQIISEMMGNAVEHAYTSVQSKKNKWYLIAHFDMKNNQVNFAFIDNGETIPKTIAKKRLEKFTELISNKTGLGKRLDCKLINYALRKNSGRSRTLQSNRGKGLPALQKCSDNKEICNLILVSRNAHIDLARRKHMVLDNAFKGTLYSWSFQKKGNGYENSND